MSNYVSKHCLIYPYMETCRMFQYLPGCVELIIGFTTRLAPINSATHDFTCLVSSQVWFPLCCWCHPQISTAYVELLVVLPGFGITSTYNPHLGFRRVGLGCSSTLSEPEASWATLEQFMSGPCPRKLSANKVSCAAFQIIHL